MQTYNQRLSIRLKNGGFDGIDIPSLRSTLKHAPRRAPWVKLVADCFASLLLWQTSKNSMCKYYGHVVRGRWSGLFPKCADCGKTIEDPKQLRKSTTA
jgi:hypothetical protein